MNFNANNLKTGSYAFFLLAVVLIGISFGPGGIVSLVFIALKLTNQIHWAWFYVVGPTLFGILGALFFAIVGFAYEIIKGE